MLGLGCIVMLRSAGGRAWFSGTQSPVPNRWLILFPIIVSTAIAIFDGVITKRALINERQALIDAAFTFDCRFIFVDVTTGKRVQSVGIGSTQFCFPKGDDDQPPRAKTKLVFPWDSEGPIIIVKGMAFAPHKIQFTADGYQPADFTIKENTSGTVEISLKQVGAP